MLGTNASLWPELIGLVETPEQGALLDSYFGLDEKVVARTVSEDDLKGWQDAINERQKLVEVRCCFVDEALTREGQSRIARHLLEQVPRDCDVVFDVSHGFRHQPIIATHVVSMMRWTHGIRSVRFFSGVLEASRNGVAPVVELPICQQLAETTEAAATLELTGNYEPLAKQLQVDAGTAWFFESTNQIHAARAPATRLCKDLHARLEANGDPVKRVATQMLVRQFEWIDAERFTGRFFELACKAIDHDDYFRAIILAYESILVLAVTRLVTPGDPLNYNHRGAAEERLPAKLSQEDRDFLRQLKAVRNACAHGSRSNTDEAQATLHDPSAFRNVLERAQRLFRKLNDQLKEDRQPVVPG